MTFRALFALVLFLTSWQSADASASELASIAREDILVDMPGWKDALAEMVRLQEQTAYAIKERQEAIEQRYQALLHPSGMSQEQQAMEQEKLMSGQRALEAFISAAEQRLAETKDKLFGPLIEKFDAAVAAVAQDEGIDFVIDEEDIVHRTGKSITPLVRSKLKI